MFRIFVGVMFACALASDFLELSIIRFLNSKGIKAHSSWIRGFSPIQNYALAMRVCRKLSLPHPIPLKVMHFTMGIPFLGAIGWIGILVVFGLQHQN